MHRSVPLSVVQLHSPTFVTTSPRAQRPESDVVREERNQWPATTDSGLCLHGREASACKPTTTTGSAPIPVTSGEKQDRKATVKSDQQQISETSSEQAGRSTTQWLRYRGCEN
ncbi:hypothetical protein TNCV_1327901 [Trichonephila clavipes]|nr:hypothetical protein TNCV_1327901 [Trichonephila clavipes]